MKMSRRLVFAAALVVMLAGAACGETLLKEHEALFTKYFSDRIRAGSVLPVIMATEDDLRRGVIPTLNLCLEDAVIEGVHFDRLLLVMRDVLFTAPARGIVIHSHGDSHLSGGISKESFLSTLSEVMPRFAVSDLDLNGGKVMIKGVYERKMTFKVRALMRFTGAYSIDADGAAKVRFHEATNDNPAVSSSDVAKALANAASPLSFKDFFGAPVVREVLVDHDMVWFTANSTK